MYNQRQYGGSSTSSAAAGPGASRPMQQIGRPGMTSASPTSRFSQPSSGRISSSSRPGPESRSVPSPPRNPVRSNVPGVRPLQHMTRNGQNQPTSICASPRGNGIGNSSQPAIQREMGDNYVWVRTELVQAIWSNHGKLPPNWKPTKKRGRQIPSWGWMRAQILQSSSVGGGNAAIGQHRLRGSSNHGKSILATMKIEDELFAPSELKNATVSFSYQSGDSDTVCPANTWWKKPNPVAPTDLCSLTHLHEPSVVFCLKERYRQDIIYTYTGKILLALNPFRVVDGVYGDQVMKQYWKPVSLERPPPHAYAIAQDAYKSLLDMKEDQSVLVSGESGSGKTVTTKIIMGYLATQSRRVQANQNSHTEGVESQILQSNPILESFGNARTIRNDNSSRFGKYMELLFTPSGTLLSASVQTYLLEKVRLITQAPGERNYHVFYEVLAGVSQKERQLLKIANVTARDFRMTAASGTFDRRDGVDDRETYQDLRKALDTVGFSVEEQRAMLAVVCALLHTSNIDFQQAAGDGSSLVRSASLRCALSLLGVPMEALNNALCLCAIEARGEVFHKNMSVSQAEKALEALIKATYGALFAYIVQQINKSITGENSLDIAVDSLPRIGVLDIFGFESFDFNSFEQLCINYCNEALQQQFNRFVFKLEQEEYKQEGIDWSFIDFPDNQDILDLIEKKRVGILSILDENCRLNSQTDSSFVRAVYDKCSKHPRFLGTNTQKANLQFSINHYAGVVTYDCIIFLEKNKDELPKETTELLSSSSVPFLSHLGELLTDDCSSLGGGSDRKPTGSPVKSASHYGQQFNPKNFKRGSSSMIRESVGSQFSTQLRELRDRVDSTTPHYVRCLKPNDQLVPHMFETHVIADQLRCAGVLEAIRVARVGFPHRFIHDQFLERYSILGKSKVNGLVRSSASQRCVSLVNAVLPVIIAVLEQEGSIQDRNELQKMVSLGMQIGHNKVFLRRKVFETLEYLRTRQLGISAIVIQKHARRYIAQMRYIEVYIATLTLQCFARRISSYRKFNLMLEAKAATMIQAQWRRFLAETELIAARLIAHFCQAFVRGVLARRLFSMMRVETHALSIQTCWRRYRHSSIFWDLRTAVIVVQCFWRQRAAIRVVRQLRREAQDLGVVAEERDHFKEESLHLRQEVERLRVTRSSGSGQLTAGDDEVTRLRQEIERLQSALSAQGTPLGAPVDDAHITPHSGASKGRQSWFFGRGGDSASVVSSSSFSIPGIKRVFSRSEANNSSDSPSKISGNSFSQDATSPGMSSNVSLLDAIGDSEVADYQLRSVADNSSVNSPQIYSMTAANSESLFPLSERRGLDFCRELQRLHDSIRNNDIRSIEQMLMMSQEPHVLVSEADEKGHTALHTAVIAESMKAARILIEQGAIVNAQDNLGQTPLHLAFGAPMTSLLLELGNANPNIPNMDGLCALHLSVQRFDVGSVRYLLKKNAKIDTADNVRWFTPLHIAALPDGSGDEVKMKARRMIVDLLCNSSETKPDLNDQDNEGNTPLHYAVQIDTEEACHIINIFLQNGADPRISNNRNQQPLLLLCHNNPLRRYNAFQECLHAMLFHGANPNQTSDSGCTPLHLSLFHKDIDSAVQLINRAAELHLLWRKPKRWVSFWDDMGSSEVLPLDMVQDENTLYRILAAITHPPKWAPTRTWCMSCKTPLGSFARAIHCRHCGRHVCGACTRCTLTPEFFPKTFEIYEASWVCFVCEKILVARKEDNSTGTQPISSVGDEDERFYPSALDI